jgi:hypothetical protein
LGSANEIAAEVWDANQRTWVESLAREGVDIDFERDFPEHPVRLPVLVERLCGSGVDSGDPVRVHARFRSFFARLPAASYARLPTSTQAATVVHDAGGVALLAHPFPLLEEGILERLLEGCDGLEAMYGPYTDRQRDELRAVAEKHGKLYSCGSDYHGYFSTDYRRPIWPAPSQLLRRLGIAPS